MSIVAVSFPFPGVRRVLQEGEKLGFWPYHELIPNFSWRVERDDVVLLGAWHPEYEATLEALSADGVKVGVLWTSCAGEVSLTLQEWGYLKKVIEDDRVSFVWFGDPGLATITAKGFYHPYPMAIPPALFIPEEVVVDSTPVDGGVGLFQPATTKKNLFTQLLAAHLLNRDFNLKLHTNIPRLCLEAFPLPLDVESYSWLEQREYHKTLARCRLNLNLSFAETFSYQVAEATCLGVPSIVTPAVPWMPEAYMVESPHTAAQVCDVAGFILSDPHRAISSMRGALGSYALEANRGLTERIMEAVEVGT